MKVLQTLDEATINVVKDDEASEISADFIHSKGGRVIQYIKLALAFFILISMIIIALNIIILWILKILVFLHPSFQIFTGLFPSGTKNYFLLLIITVLTLYLCIFPAVNRHQNLVVISSDDKIIELEKTDNTNYRVKREMEFSEIEDITHNNKEVKIKGKSNSFSVKLEYVEEIQELIYKI